LKFEFLFDFVNLGNDINALHPHWDVFMCSDVNHVFCKERDAVEFAVDLQVVTSNDFTAKVERVL